MKGTPSEPAISLSLPATSICSCSDSTTQGPAIRNSGRSSPTSNPQSFMPARSSSDSHGPLGLVRERGVDERLEKRVAAPGRRLELRMELDADEPRVHARRQLDDLGELLALRDRRDHKTRVREPVEVVLVGLVAMAMTLGQDVAVDLVRERPGLDVGALRAEAHRAAEIGLGIARLDRAVAVFPFVDQGDHRMLGLGIELGAVGAGEAGLVARVLDRRDLHAEADAEVGNLLLARELRGEDLALDAALAEAAGHEDRIEARQVGDVRGGDVLGVDRLDLD